MCLRTNCCSLGGQGKGPVWWFLYNAEHINGTHQIPYLFYLWLSGLGGKKKRLEFIKNKTNSKQGISAKLPASLKAYFLSSQRF